MVQKVKYIFFFIFTSLAISCGPVHDSDGSATNESLGADSAEIFSKTLYPIIKNNCAICHNGSTGAAPFALSTANESQDSLLSLGLVDLNTPDSSKIIEKIANGHNGISTDLANDISTQIDDWFSQLSDTETSE